ncbi:MAG: DUF2381 family protein [Hyalangium sp.]|uniref:DUF2381 family protein n=1 Tax=Hyalangium sp. TaxID=2028555 RepID=UPI00389AAD2E
MHLRSPGVLLVLLWLANPSVARAQAAVPCQTEARRIELVAGSAPAPELCISPGVATTLLFERALVEEAVVLEGRERFRRVEAAGNLLVLVPSEQLQPGERLRLQVRFAKGAVPESATFVLGVHRGQAEHLVEVSFPPPPADTCQVELQSKQAQLQRCLEEHSQLSAGGEGRNTLAGLIAANLVNEKGLSISELSAQELSFAPADTFNVARMTLYRSSKRLAIELELENLNGDTPWVPEGAALQGQPGEVLEALSVLHRAPRVPGGGQLIWVELALPSERAHRTFTLTLWNAGKARTLTLQGVKLP